MIKFQFPIPRLIHIDCKSCFDNVNQLINYIKDVLISFDEKWSETDIAQGICSILGTFLTLGTPGGGVIFLKARCFLTDLFFSGDCWPFSFLSSFRINVAEWPSAMSLNKKKQALNDQNITILCSIPKTSILANSGKLCWQVINFCVDDNMILLFDKLFFLANQFSISPCSPPLVWDLDPASFWKCFPYPLAAP